MPNAVSWWRNQDHNLKASLIGISQASEKTGRIKGDGTAFPGNCTHLTYNRDHEDHNKMGLIITTYKYMMNNNNLPKVFGKSSSSNTEHLPLHQMEIYLSCTHALVLVSGKELQFTYMYII